MNENRHECVCTSSGYHLPRPEDCTQEDRDGYRWWYSKSGNFLRAEPLEKAIALGYDVHTMQQTTLM